MFFCGEVGRGKVAGGKGGRGDEEMETGGGERWGGGRRGVETKGEADRKVGARFRMQEIKRSPKIHAEHIHDMTRVAPTALLPPCLSFEATERLNLGMRQELPKRRKTKSRRGEVVET